ERMTVGLDELRRGSGQLFDALARIDSGLVRELASTRSTADAIDILARAYARLDDAASRNALTRAIGGRGNLGSGQLLQAVGAGGLGALTAGTTPLIDSSTIERVVQARREIDELRETTARAYQQLFGEPAIALERAWLQEMQSVLEILERIKN